MILASADKDCTVVLGDPRAQLQPRQRSRRTSTPTPAAPATALTPGGGGPAAALPARPKREQQEQAEACWPKCTVCGHRVPPDEAAEHSQKCAVGPTPHQHLVLHLDKWQLLAANLTPAEQRALLEMRRAEELARSGELERQLKRRPLHLWWMTGKFGFIVSSRWLREWHGFVGMNTGSKPNSPASWAIIGSIGGAGSGGSSGSNGAVRDRPPPPISNSDLLQPDGSVRMGLEQGLGHDYSVLNESLWQFFAQIYGGGPPIVRYGTSEALPGLGDAPVAFEGDWRHLRPDSGSGRVFDPLSGCGFDGEIRDGFLWSCTGKGLLRSGSHYDGRVEQGLPEGRGREVRPDGTILEGSFRKGLLHGYGRITDARGRREEGEWAEGTLEGL